MTTKTKKNHYVCKTIKSKLYLKKCTRKENIEKQTENKLKNRQTSVIIHKVTVILTLALTNKVDIIVKPPQSDLYSGTGINDSRL